MDTLEDLSLYFYIACGVGLGLHLLTFCLLCIFYCKIKRLAKADGIPGVSFWRNYLHLYLIYDASIQDDEKGTKEKRKREIEREYVSNQLGRQTNMMADFCYTNPTIVPGEELSRRGFSMYCGSDSFNEDSNSKHKDINYGTYHEALSKF